MEESKKNRIVITIGLIGFVTLLAFQNCSHANIEDSGSIQAEGQIEGNGILNMNDALTESASE